MINFTNGPWTVNNRGRHWNNEDLERLEINYGLDGECVCDTVYEMADANLISAAPEMYEALEAFVSNSSIYANYTAECEAAEIALAKARGKAE
jgi:hypothetical protein